MQGQIVEKVWIDPPTYWAATENLTQAHARWSASSEVAWCVSDRERHRDAGPVRAVDADSSSFAGRVEDSCGWPGTEILATFDIPAHLRKIGLGLAIALLLNRQFAGRALVRALLLIPWAVPGVVVARFWEWILNSDYGVVNYLLGTRVNWLGDPAWAMQAVVAADVWKTTPFVILLLLAGLQVIPLELYRAARMDGANPWQQFRHITLPLLKPMILLVLLFRTMDAARIFDVIFVLTGGGPADQTETLVIYAYKTLYRTLQFGYGSALSVATFLFVLVLSLVYLQRLRHAWRLREE